MSWAVLHTNHINMAHCPGPDHCKRYRVGQNPLDAAEGSVQRCEVLISLREARKMFFTFIFQVSGRGGSRGGHRPPPPPPPPFCFFTASFSSLLTCCRYVATPGLASSARNTVLASSARNTVRCLKPKRLGNETTI